MGCATRHTETVPPIMRTFTDADQAYREAIEAPGRDLRAAFASAFAVSTVDLNTTDITQAVLLRLKSFMLCQEQIKAELGKIYAAPAADFFVETVCFFLKVVLGKLDSSLTVASEKNILRRRGGMRPDISIWRGETVVGAIECKTQLGWNRRGWLPEFEKREKQLTADFPHAKLFLLVMTGSNWPGFGDDTRVGQQFFVLLKDTWPNLFEVSATATTVFHPIEAIFREVVNHATAITKFKSTCAKSRAGAATSS